MFRILEKKFKNFSKYFFQIKKKAPVIPADSGAVSIGDNVFEVDPKTGNIRRRVVLTEKEWDFLFTFIHPLKFFWGFLGFFRIF